jgi:hypothetical protein
MNVLSVRLRARGDGGAADRERVAQEYASIGFHTDELVDSSLTLVDCHARGRRARMKNADVNERFRCAAKW